MSEDKKLSREEIEQLMKTDPWWKEISDELDRVYMLHRLNEIVSDEQKSEVIQALFEYLLISEDDLTTAQSDPVFIEARTIIEGLNSGDTFPDRLVDLCNSKVPEALNRIDQAVSTLIPLLSNTTVQTEVERLWATNRAVFESIDINQLPRNLYVSSPDDRYILRCIRKLLHLDSQFRNGRVYPFGSDAYVPAAVSPSDQDHIAVGMGAIDESTAASVNRRAQYLAYRVYDPLWAQEMERFEPEYVSFKFKWLNDAELLRSLYERHKHGQDVSSVFVSFYKNEDRLIRLQNAISSCPITQPYNKAFTESVDSYRDKRFSVCATSLLPMIEGIIWEFAWWWNEINGGLFDRNITRAEYKSSSNFELLKADGSKIGGRPNVGKLLRQTRFGDQVYFEVVEHLVGELFEERNPVLHGREPAYGIEKKAAALLFVIETLERQITGAIKEHLGKNLTDSLTNAASTP
jgi:hypothetical protein